MTLDSNAILPRVSIIIVTWNALPLLKQCLPSVVETDYPNLEIIIADNASTDGSSEWIERTFPSICIVRHPENWAFCRGNNEAIKHATGEFIVLLNNDVEVPPDWLLPLVEVLTSHPNVAAVQPKLLQYIDRGRFEYAGGSGGFIDKYGYPFTRGRIFFTMEEDTGQYDDARDIFWATGAAILLRRTALDVVGLLDERFVLHMEEIDLCWRLKRAGFLIRVAPSSQVYHIGGGSLPQGSPQKVYYNFRNSLLMLYKNLPDSAWRKVFPRRLMLDGLALMRAFFSGKPKETAAIVRAYRDAHRLIKEIAMERTQSHPHPILPSYRGSIVIDYFLKRRQFYSELPSGRFLEEEAVRPAFDSGNLDKDSSHFELGIRRGRTP